MEIRKGRNVNYDIITNYAQDGFIGLCIFLLGMIKIPKIEINLWSFLLEKVGKALNRDMYKKVDSLQKELQNHIKEDGEEMARASRYRILRCEGELRRGIPYTKEAYDELLEDVKRYNKFCSEHKDFENYKAVVAIDYILEEYAEYIRENKFLA